MPNFTHKTANFGLLFNIKRQNQPSNKHCAMSRKKMGIYFFSHFIFHFRLQHIGGIIDSAPSPLTWWPYIAQKDKITQRYKKCIYMRTFYLKDPIQR